MSDARAPRDDDPDADATRLAAEALAEGQPTAWFERLYAEAAEGKATVPWDRDAPSATLVEWFAGRSGDGRSAMVVGCGLGRDSEFVASLGYGTTAFDVSSTAIEQVQARHPSTAVDYRVADLLELPDEWHGAFDLVVESHNVQSLPPQLHAAASAAVASLVASGDTLLALGALVDGAADGPPWPLTRDEIDGFAADGMTLVSLDESGDDVRRWRAEFAR